MANILIVDDSRTSRKILKGILEGEGYEVVGEATNGQEGYDRYAELKPDVVTMDITMPVQIKDIHRPVSSTTLTPDYL